MGKDQEKSLFNLTWPRWSLWSWITMLRNFGGQPRCSMIIHSPSQFDHPQFGSPCQILWSGLQTIHTILCFAPCISLGVVWGWTTCLWCPCWLWTHTGFLVDGLQWWWIPICLGIHKQGLFLRWRAEWSPNSWSNLTFLPCFCTRWKWLHHGDHLEVCPAPKNRQGVHRIYCVMLILLYSRALVEFRQLLLPCHSSNALWLW